VAGGTKITPFPQAVMEACFNSPLELWTEISAKNPRFKKVYDSQRAYASKVVPAKRFMFPPYNLQADHYWPAKTQ